MKIRKTGAAAILSALAAFSSAQASNAATPPKSLRLYVFDCGTLEIPDTAPYQLKPEEMATKNMSVACFLVAHPKGTLMWDTGAVPDSAFKPGAATATLRYATSRRPLEAEMNEAGYSPADITYLALSHFHWDHVGNSNLFARSTWLVRKEERDTMFADLPVKQMVARTEPANFSALKNTKTIFITKNEYDVFGDGSVVIKA